MPQVVEELPVDFTYRQSTGEILYGANLLGVGHAGNGTGLNNPAAQDQHNVGPLPRGRYTIEPEASSSRLGIIAMRLTPNLENEMFDRSGFFIHAPDFSEGCIVQQETTRCLIAEYVRHGRNQLEVVG